LNWTRSNQIQNYKSFKAHNTQKKPLKIKISENNFKNKKRKIPHKNANKSSKSKTFSIKNL